VASLALAGARPSPAAAPPEGAWFEYRFVRAVDQGQGEYEGYRDETRSEGRYAVQGVLGDTCEMQGDYAWTYTSTEGKREQGHPTPLFRFSTSTRRYQSPIDLDDAEFTAQDAGSLAVWMWIPPDVAEGDVVRILDQDYTVVGRESPPPGRGGAAIELRAKGTGSRSDEYGQLTKTWEDAYWFDPTTGFVLAERYTEQDRGTYQGRTAAFRLTDSLDVTSASYAEALPAPAARPRRAPAPRRLDTEPGGGGRAVFVIVAAGLAGLAGWGLRRHLLRPRSVVTRTHGTVGISWLDDPSSLARWPEVAAATLLAPFLHDFARKAAACGERVAVATAGPRLVGLAWKDREANLGTILCPDTDATEALRRWTDSTEFFSEVRHLTAAGQPRYNVHETYAVLALEHVVELPHDRAVVARMRPEEQPAVAELMKDAFGVPVVRWLDAQLRAGDLAFVARADGALAGAGLASACGEHGRIHSVAVRPAQREQGLASELVRARLSALAALGVRRVVAEVASWNVGMLHVLRSHGFQDAGEIVVETPRPVRAQLSIVRR
jgi:ribosomal protein S18 acetylase RimI-like enzyme